MADGDGANASLLFGEESRAGRLIRSMSDRGVIVFLDSRVTEKNYGRKFTRAFPNKMRVVKDLNAIPSFLAAS